MTYRYNQGYKEKENAINQLIADNGLTGTIPEYRYNKNYKEKENIINALSENLILSGVIKKYRYNLSYKEKEDIINNLIAYSEFSPTELQTLELWTDAKDSGTITESGGFVSQWDDKSANGHDLTQVVGASQLLYNAINDSVDFLVDNMDIPSLSYKEAFFVVDSANGSDINTNICPLIGKDETNTEFVFLGTGTNVYTISVDGNVGATGSASINGGTVYSGRNIAILDPTGFNPFPSTADKNIINYRLDEPFIADFLCKFIGGTSSPISNINISEVVLVSADLTDEERSKMLSYLKRKWGV